MVIWGYFDGCFAAYMWFIGVSIVSPYFGLLFFIWNLPVCSFLFVSAFGPCFNALLFLNQNGKE